MNAPRHLSPPPPRRWPWSHVAIAAGAATGLLIAPVAAWAQSAAPAPAVDVTADQPPAQVPPVVRAVVPSIGALPATPSAPLQAPQSAAPASTARVTVTAQPTGSTGPRTAIATVVITAPGETTIATATTTAVHTVTATPPPVAAGTSTPTTSTTPEPTPTTPVDVIDQVLDGLIGQETP